MSLKRRWLWVIGAVLLHPILMHTLFPIFGHTVNAISFIPPVLATVFLGLRLGFGAAAVSIVFTAVVFHLNDPMVPKEWIPRSILSFAITMLVCFGTDWARRRFFLHREAQSDLEETEEQYRLIFENSAQGIVCLDHRGVVTDANKQALALLNIDNMQINRIRWENIDGLSEEVRNLFNNSGGCTEQDVRNDISTEIQSPECELIALDITISTILQRKRNARWVLMLKDTTEKRKMEAQLQQAQKMESIGRLAGGVAHDINNILNAIMGASFALNKELKNGGDVSGDLETITSACDQGAQLTRNLLGFARKNHFSNEVFPINHVVESVLALIRRTIPKNISIDASLQDGPILMRGDAALIESAIMNLCLNALDAMGDTGVLKIKTRTKNGHFFLSVGDTGSGIDAAVKEHIFEPFFTTKPVGKGTGLGLAMVYGAVEQHKGRIGIESVPGKGTTMVMTFPRYDGEIEKVDALVNTSFEEGDAPLDDLTILLVDDEPIVLRAAHRMLSTLGATVVQARSGSDALTQFKQHQQRIQIVILDLVMPEMDGTALLKQLRMLNPRIPALIASGFSPEPEKLHQLKSEIPRFEFLKKPYKAIDLVQAIEALGIVTSRESSDSQRLSSSRK
ncbi:MAG: response regulator [Deltaproteobacteria bacterium]|nr:response regulator [Deltaproteobacteria bacterium]MBN2673672.1 response regulator [Deltaproteobacteria bacterium]